MAVEATERIWQDKVVQLARISGWRVDHTPAMRYGNGAIATGGLKGKPDLELIRDGLNNKSEVIRAEMKTDIGRLSPEQRAYLRSLHNAGIEVYVWRPRDWDFIYARLTQPPPS